MQVALQRGQLAGHRIPRRAHARDFALHASLEGVWARDDDDVRQAQQLRYLVFAEEMGARLVVPPGSPARHDIDLFDAYCEHLLVRAVGLDAGPGPVIGTYRVLTPAAAR